MQKNRMNYKCGKVTGRNIKKKTEKERKHAAIFDDYLMPCKLKLKI